MVGRRWRAGEGLSDDTALARLASGLLALPPESKRSGLVSEEVGRAADASA
jgi:hypothetical protein